MKVFTKEFVDQSKMIGCFNQPGDRKFVSIYLNFNDSYAYLFDSRYEGRFKFTFEKQEDEVIDNFYVDITQFMALCSSYEYLNLSEDLEFSNEKEKFKIATFKDEFEPLSYDTSDCITQTLSSDLMSCLKKSLSFIGTEDFTTNYNGILLEENNIVSTNGYSVFHGQFDNSFLYPKIQFPSYIIKLILAGELGSVNLNYKENENIILSFQDDAFQVIFRETENLRLPPYNDPDYIDKYNHKENFIINKEKFVEILKFFEPFVRNIKNQRINIKFQESSIEIYTEDEVKVNRNLIAEVHKDLIGKELFCIRDVVLAACNNISEEFIKIQFNSEKPAINVTGKDNTNIHIAIIRLID